jgi:hypothetical protein
MVIPDEGVQHLYAPFGAGYLPGVLREKMGDAPDSNDD